MDFLAIEITSKKKWKECGFFDHRNYIKKNKWEQCGFFDQRNYFEKSTWKQRGFFDQRNYIEKVRGNDVGFVEIWSLTYRRNIDVELTWIRRGVPVGLDLYKHQYCNSIY